MHDDERHSQINSTNLTSSDCARFVAVARSTSKTVVIFIPASSFIPAGNMIEFFSEKEKKSL